MKKEQFTTRYNEELVFPDKFLETVKCEVMIKDKWVETEFYMKIKKKPKGNSNTVYEDVRFTCMIK